MGKVKKTAATRMQTFFQKKLVDAYKYFQLNARMYWLAFNLFTWQGKSMSLGFLFPDFFFKSEGKLQSALGLGFFQYRQKSKQIREREERKPPT